MQIGIIELIGFAITLIGAFWALLALLFKQFETSITRQFIALEEDAKEWARLEREFLVFQRDLPLNYVRREDYVRNQSVIESKLDALAVRLENWQLKEVAKK
jgi:type II secretory pathway component PulJ